MYLVSKLKHEKYGNIIEISRSETGELKTPFQAVNKARIMRRVWREEGASKVRVLVDGKVFSMTHIESWANQEYDALPKCENCANLLQEEVFNHQLTNNLFCSQQCADKDYDYHFSKREDEEECDYL